MSGIVRSGGASFGRVWGKTSAPLAGSSLTARLPKSGDYKFHDQPWLQRDENGLFPLMAEEKTDEGYLRISPLQLKSMYTPGNDRVSVTSASAPFCEVRTLYELAGVAAEPEKPSQAMEGGAAVHSKAEDKLYQGVATVVVRQKATTRAQEWYEKLMLMYQKLAIMRTATPPSDSELNMSVTFMSREIPVFGVYNNTRIYGILDLIYWRNEKLHICDMKTQAIREVPLERIVTSHVYQTMMYHYLFGAMCDDIHGTIGEYLRDEIDLDAEVGAAFLEGYDSPGHYIPPTVNGLIEMIGDALPSSNHLADTVSVEYVKRTKDKVPKEYQELYPLSDFTQPQSFAVVQVPVDYGKLKQILSETLPFWHGERAAIGVDADSWLKCKNCQFRSVCSWHN